MMFVKNHFFFLLFRKFKFVVICVVIFIIPIHAFKHSWLDSKVYAEGSYIFGYNNQYNVYLKIMENDWQEKVVALVLPKDECIGSESEATPLTVKIDGAKVPMLQKCVDKDVAILFSATEAGIEYIINEFHTRKAVKYKWTIEDKKMSFIFSAKGFDNAYNDFKSDF